MCRLGYWSYDGKAWYVMIEYWLQKKSLGGWSTVTWYGANELAVAQASFKLCVGKGLSGFSWRLVSVTVVEQALLDEVTEIEAPEIKLPISPRAGQSFTITNKTDKPVKVSGWGTETVLAPKLSWEQPPTPKAAWGKAVVNPKAVSIGWGTVDPADPYAKENRLNETDGFYAKPAKWHGLIGSVWFIHHKDKKKCRVPITAVDEMLKLGYERGGPKTKFRE